MINIGVYLYAPFPVVSMWSDIIHEFADSPSQSRVVRFLLENGFGVTADGRISCNGIEVPATAVAKAIGSDRRVVDATARRILERPFLRDFFLNIRVTPDLSGVAESLGLTVITVLPKNASERGIVGAAVRVIADYYLSIRQIFVTDPQFSEEPKLVIIVEEPLPPGVVEQIRALPQVKQVII
jgi:predicted regulator of amino acid metabolism with ACT domain